MNLRLASPTAPYRPADWQTSLSQLNAIVNIARRPTCIPGVGNGPDKPDPAYQLAPEPIEGVKEDQ